MTALHFFGTPLLFLQRGCDPVEPSIDGCDLGLQRLYLRPGCRVQDTDRRTALRALHERELGAPTDRREQRELKTVACAFDTCRDCHCTSLSAGHHCWALRI